MNDGIGLRRSIIRISRMNYSDGSTIFRDAEGSRRSTAVGNDCWPIIDANDIDSNRLVCCAVLARDCEAVTRVRACGKMLDERVVHRVAPVPVTIDGIGAELVGGVVRRCSDHLTMSLVVVRIADGQRADVGEGSILSDAARSIAGD